MTRLRDAGETNRNSESWSESHSGKSQRRRSVTQLNNQILKIRSDVVDQTQPEVRSRTVPYGGGTRRGPTVASPVILPDHRDTNGWSQARTQLEVEPEEVQEPEPNQGNGRHGPTVAEPIMLRSDRRQHTNSHRSERQHHPYRFSRHQQSRREHPTRTQHGPKTKTEWPAYSTNASGRNK